MLKEDVFKVSSGTDGVLWCVGVKIEKDKVLVKNTKDESGKVLTFTHNEWKVFIEI